MLPQKSALLNLLNVTEVDLLVQRLTAFAGRFEEENIGLRVVADQVVDEDDLVVSHEQTSRLLCKGREALHFVACKHFFAGRLQRRQNVVEHDLFVRTLQLFGCLATQRLVEETN